MKFTTHYRQTLWALLFSLLLLSLLRLVFYFMYQSDFSSLTPWETVESFFMGVRVDISTLFVFLALPILMSTFPIKAVYNRVYRHTISALFSIIMIGIMVLVISDMLYYSFVHRHMASELFLLGSDTGIIIDMMFDFYLLETLLSFVFFIFVTMVYIKIFSIPVKQTRFTKRDGFAYFLIILTLFMGIRQSFHGRSFGIPDAFAVSKVASGYLAINGLFSTYRSSKSKRHIDHSKINVNETRTLFQSDETAFNSEQYPMMRHYTDTNKTHQYNVVMILLESWSAKFVDSFGGNGFGATPNFDKLSKESLKFTNFYANGQRSIEGITAMLAGITQPSSFPNIGWGLELNNLSYIGNIAKNHHYSTIAMQSSSRNSFHVDGITKLAGFDDYSGAEDMQIGDRESKKTQPKFGTWDGNMFRHLAKKLDSAQAPFMSFCFTSTTHSPFYSPGKEWEIYKHDNASYYGYLNTLHYSDAMLGEFMEHAKSAPWFDDTIFIFTADHTLGFDIDEKHAALEQNFLKNDTVLDRHHIPLLIYAPKIFKARESNKLASQSDIFASIIDILDFDDEFASTGNSLFDESVERRNIFFREGTVLGYSENNSTILMNYGKVMSSNVDEKSTLEAKRSLESLDNTLSGLLDQNRWAKP